MQYTWYTTYTKNNIYVCYTLSFHPRIHPLVIYIEREEDGLLQAFYIYIHIHIHILIPSMASIVNAGARTVSKKSTHANKRLILLFKQTDLRLVFLKNLGPKQIRSSMNYF